MIYNDEIETITSGFTSFIQTNSQNSRVKVYKNACLYL
jgi:hypothetical protein